MSATLIGLITMAIASAITGIYQGVQNHFDIESTNESNQRLQQMANDAQIQQIRETNAFNSAEAEKQRQWQTEMSNTQVQRAMADYAAAGLNPLLAVPSGNYAAPSGYSASGNVANIGSSKDIPATIDLSGVTSALSSMSNLMLISMMKNNSSLNNSSVLDKELIKSLKKSGLSAAAAKAIATEKANSEGFDIL